MSMYQMQLDAEKHKQELDACVRQGLKNLKEDGYDKEKLNRIIANEKTYQAYYKNRFPTSDVPTHSIALIKVCEILLTELNCLQQELPIA